MVFWLFDFRQVSLTFTFLMHKIKGGFISLVAQLIKNPPAVRKTWVRSLRWEDPHGEGTGYPHQYFGLENSMDSVVHGVTKSLTRLSLWLLFSKVVLSKIQSWSTDSPLLGLYRLLESASSSPTPLPPAKNLLIFLRPMHVCPFTVKHWTWTVCVFHIFK